MPTISEQLRDLANRISRIRRREEGDPPMDMPAYFREHGNPEAAEKWEQMNKEHGDKFKKDSSFGRNDWVEGRATTWEYTATLPDGSDVLLEWVERTGWILSSDTHSLRVELRPKYLYQARDAQGQAIAELHKAGLI